MGVVSLLCACASHGGGARGASDADGTVESLPRHLTVELHPDGALQLDGQPSALDRLQGELSTAWRSGEFAAALLWADVGTAQADVQRVLDIFLGAGIAQWRFAWRGSPAGPAPTAPAEPPARAGLKPAPTTAANDAAPPSAAAPSAPAAPDPNAISKINLKTIGLHVGGGPNDDATRKPLLALLELSFPDLQRCAAQLSPLPTQLTSFGIDLYVGAKGGHAEARQIRTRLGPEAFRVCVKQALTVLNFPAPPKPRVISYSVAFSPVSAVSTQ